MSVKKKVYKPIAIILVNITKHNVRLKKITEKYQCRQTYKQ